MIVVPLGANVIVKRLASEHVTAGGIALPDNAQAKPQQGKVLSVGDGHLLPCGTRVQHQVSEGDRVIFDRYAGTEVIVNGVELLILPENEILAVVT